MINKHAAAIAVAAILTSACGNPLEDSPAKHDVKRVKITQFYAADKMIPRGLTGKLCYGVENATKLEMNPPSQDVWPSAMRCVEISPKQKTTYTLTAYGEDGSKDVKSLDVNVGGEPPRVYDLRVTSPEVRAGNSVQICFKVENATKVKAGPGKFNNSLNCLTDTPRKTTTYRVVAYGENRQEDVGTVTVKVRPK